MAVAYAVLAPRVDLGAGRFGPGDVVYDVWLDGAGDRLVHMGLLSPGFPVDDDAVPANDQTHLPAMDDVVGPAADVEVDAEAEVEGLSEVEITAADVVGMKAADVLVWLEDHPDQLDAVITAETDGKGRAGLLAELHARRDAPGGGS